MKDFDLQHERRMKGAKVSADERYRLAQLSRTHVQARLRAILDAPEVVLTPNGERVSMPALEAMTHKLVDMVLGKGEFVGIKDNVRIQAYKAVCERVLGAPKQHIEHSTVSHTADDDLEDLSPDALKALESAHETILDLGKMEHVKSL